MVRGSRVARSAERLLAASEPLVADCGDGVRLLLQHTPPAAAGDRGLVVLIHGWEGCGDSAYVVSAANRLWRAGYRIVRLNLRDHGDSLHLNEGIFHSCRIDEAVGAVQWIAGRFPDEAIHLTGFSLGGNFALRIAALAPAAGIAIARVAVVCPVLKPARTMVALDTGWPLYRWYFMRKWRRSLEGKKAAYPHLYEFGNLERFTTLASMTDYFVRQYTEYPDLMTYLEGYALTDGRLLSIEAPARMLLAEDDPVIPFADSRDVARPGSLRLDVTRHGGHGGFVKDYRLNSWVDDYIVRAFADDI